MDERVFFEGAGSCVTSSKIVIDGNTYATRNVGSVRMVEVDKPFWPWIVFAFGMFMCMGSMVIGLCIVALGVGLIYAMKEGVKLLLMAGGGESVAIESTNVAHVKQLHAAIVEAISAR